MQRLGRDEAARRAIATKRDHAHAAFTEQRARLVALAVRLEIRQLGANLPERLFTAGEREA